MTAAALAKAHNRVSNAQAALDQALAAGEPTAAHREVLELAQQELARLASETGTAAQADADVAEIQVEAHRLAESVRGELAGAVTAMLDFAVVDPSLPETIAQSLVLARRQQAEHAAKVAEHEGRIEALRDRLAALQAERNQVIARRAEGRQEPDDGFALAMLDADTDGLHSLIGRTESEAPGVDQSRVAEWEGAWSKAVAVERGRLLAQVAAQLDIRLAEVLDLVRQNATGPWHRVSTGLDAALRQLGR